MRVANRLHARWIATLLGFALLPFESPATDGNEAQQKITVAAAANLVFVLEALNAEFRRQQPAVVLQVSTGASGGLFAQIAHGAPFDVFLSADIEYPEAIVAAGLGDAGTLRTFARGRLVCWTTRRDLELSDLERVLRRADVKKIAIAQPTTAPYGRAAQATLESLGLWSALQPKLVRGESITQTVQFVETGNADIGFVALSAVLSPKLRHTGHWVEVPAKLFASVSLDHAAVLTARGAANPRAREYLAYLETEAARKILRSFGYRLAE